MLNCSFQKSFNLISDSTFVICSFSQLFALQQLVVKECSRKRFSDSVSKDQLRTCLLVIAVSEYLLILCRRNPSKSIQHQQMTRMTSTLNRYILLTRNLLRTIPYFSNIDVHFMTLVLSLTIMLCDFLRLPSLSIQMQFSNIS